MLLNPSVRSKFLSALLENHVRIDEGSLNRFTSCLAPFATVNTWDGYLLQKLQDRLNVAGLHRGSSCDSVYASSVDYSSAGCQMERAGVRGDDQPVAVGVEGAVCAVRTIHTLCNHRYVDGASIYGTTLAW